VAVPAFEKHETGRSCKLGQAAGRSWVCEEACALWESGGAVAPAGCLVDRVPLDLARNPEATRLLVDLRERLEGSKTARDRSAAEAELSALVGYVVLGEVSRD
jgi:hypothetical protein